MIWCNSHTCHRFRVDQFDKPPQMPHYHIVEATEAVKPVLGEYFVEPEKSGPIPFHLIKRFFKGTEVGTLPVGQTLVFQLIFCYL